MVEDRSLSKCSRKCLISKILPTVYHYIKRAVVANYCSLFIFISQRKSIIASILLDLQLSCSTSSIYETISRYSKLYLYNTLQVHGRLVRITTLSKLWNELTGFALNGFEPWWKLHLLKTATTKTVKHQLILTDYHYCIITKSVVFASKIDDDQHDDLFNK
jgi:hypothetical protein